jgi:hypothetical protein
MRDSKSSSANKANLDCNSLETDFKELYPPKDLVALNDLIDLKEVGLCKTC